MSSSSGPDPSELNDENNSGSLIAITIVFIVLLSIFATLRAVSMSIKKRPFELHDFFSYFAFVLIMGECALSFSMLAYSFSLIIPGGTLSHTSAADFLTTR